MDRGSSRPGADAGVLVAPQAGEPLCAESSCHLVLTHFQCADLIPWHSLKCWETEKPKNALFLKREQMLTPVLAHQRI